jgi:hypothetical protein
MTVCAPAFKSGKCQPHVSVIVSAMPVIQRVSRLKAWVISLVVLATVICLDLLFSPKWLLMAAFVGMCAIGLVLWALARIARKRGWGGEGLIIRKANRPRFEDERRRTSR